ncbi:MAG: hypothetical protein Q4F67_15300 [Propionibacteriaceae bacterium]|nr:hypothetical protein [Propionibacteriaceae bacterium]
MSNKNMRDLGSFEDIIAQRKEATGGDGTTFAFPGFGRDWNIAAPGLQDEEWNERWADLHTDLRDGLVTLAQYREELADLTLGEQADDFLAECRKAKLDAAQLIPAALDRFSEDAKANPTRQNSRSTRRRSKQR